MSENYTENQLVRLIYNETNLAETNELVNIMAENQDLMHSYKEMKSTADEIRSIQFYPDPTSIKLVMEYAQSLHETAE